MHYVLLKLWRVHLLSLLASLVSAAPSMDLEFAAALEECIRNNAAEAAASQPSWGDSCMPPTEKIDMQAQLLKRTLASIKDRYGYQGALWCALYSVVRCARRAVSTHATADVYLPPP